MRGHISFEMPTKADSTSLQDDIVSLRIVLSLYICTHVIIMALIWKPPPTSGCTHTQSPRLFLFSPGTVNSQHLSLTLH